MTRPEAVLGDLLRRAAKTVSRNFGTDYQETLQEAWLWAWGEDAKTGAPRYQKLDAWIEDGKPRQAYLAVVEGIGRNGYGRREWAIRKGVSYQDLDRRKNPKDPDQFDYSVALVDELLPMATNPDWTPGDDDVAEQNSATKHTKKAPSEWGNALAMVMDVRRALKAGHSSSDSIAAWLNGEAVA